MKALLFVTLVFPFSISSMEWLKHRKTAKSELKNIEPCYFVACPREVCNIIAEMLQREPNAFKKLVPETDEELIERSKSYCAHPGIRSSSIIDENELLRPYEIKHYPFYRKGKLTIDSHTKKNVLMSGYCVFNLVAHNNATKKQIGIGWGQHYTETDKILTASPDNTKIMWVEEKLKCKKNVSHYTDIITIYDLITNNKRAFKGKYENPIVGMAIANDGNTIARANCIEGKSPRKIIVAVKKLTTGKCISESFDLGIITDLSFNRQSTRLVVTRMLFYYADGYRYWHEYKIIDLASLQEQKQLQPQNKLLEIFRKYGVCKNFVFLKPKNTSDLN